MESSGEFFRWLRPQVLWVFLPWALLLFRHVRGAARQALPPDAASPWAKVIDAALLPALLADRTALPHAPASRLYRAGSGFVLSGLLLLALAGPQIHRPGHDAATRLRPDLARVLLVDLSPAFDALPEAERQALRSKLRRFVHQLPAGETALVAAAGEAWLLVPPTEDVAALEVFLAELSAAAVPVPGEQPQRGLALAQQTLAATGSTQRAIYWLHFGAGNVRGPQAGGPSGVAPIFLQPSASVEQWLHQAAAHQPPPGWTASLLNLDGRPDPGWVELGPLLILLALPFAAFLCRRWPPGFGLLLLLAGGLAVPPPAQAAEAAFEQGVALYRAQRFNEAAAAFAAAKTDDPRAHYNRGNALARSGRLRAALAAYDEALRLRPGDRSTQHNRELVARLLQNPKPPPPPPPAAPPPSTPQAEAARVAEQWLRRPPAGGEGLLQRKLALEEARRQGRREP